MIKKDTLLKEFEHIDKLEAENNITEMHISCRTSIKTDLNQMAFKEAQVWAQKCKRLWNMEGLTELQKGLAQLSKENHKFDMFLHPTRKPQKDHVQKSFQLTVVMRRGKSNKINSYESSSKRSLTTEYRKSTQLGKTLETEKTVVITR
ncbi:hypothetical protein Csa_019926 [Cucumis sativus]|nr:hypothetical protein Csa_019926 [Cucumis sativus]